MILKFYPVNEMKAFQNSIKDDFEYKIEL